MPHIGASIRDLLYFQSHFCQGNLESTAKWPKYHSCERLGWNSRFLASTWSSPGCCGHLGEWISRWKISFSVPLCHLDFWINKINLNLKKCLLNERLYPKWQRLFFFSPRCKLILIRIKLQCYWVKIISLYIAVCNCNAIKPLIFLGVSSLWNSPWLSLMKYQCISTQ